MKTKSEESVKPVGYFLSYRKENHELSIHIHEKLIAVFPSINPKNHLVERLSQFTKIFEPDIAKNFGFDNCSANCGVRDGYQIFSFLIPSDYEITEEVCEKCQGSGKDFLEHLCYECGGTQKKRISLYDKIFAISATLSLLFGYLEYVLDQDGLKIFFDQEIILASTVVNQVSGMDLMGGVSSSFSEKCKHCYDLENTSGPEEKASGKRVLSYKAEEAIGDLLDHFAGKELSRSDKYDIRAEVNARGGFVVQCPGVNGCHIYTQSSGLPYFFEDGKSICDHNIDNGNQQLMLLVGFTVLYDEVVHKGKLS
jgi:hypothetical protein